MYLDSAERKFLLPLIHCEVSNIEQLPQRALAAPRDHRQLHFFWQLLLTLRVCFAVGCHLLAETHSTKEPKLYSTRKRNHKPGREAKCLTPPPQNMEDDSNLRATLHRYSPSHRKIQLLQDHPCEHHIQGAAPLPQHTNSARHH